MLLACPNCATTYDVKADLIGESGRSLRCARCNSVWHATRSQELVVAAQPAATGSTKTESHSQPAATETPPASSANESAATSPPTGSPQQTPGQISPDAASAETSVPAVVAPPLAPADPNATPTPSSATLSPEGEDIETFARRRAEIIDKRSRALRAQFGPPVVIVALALIITALVAWRTNIVRLAPQMASLYGAIGLPVNLRELTFGDVKITKEARDGVPVLLVEGTVKSTSKQPIEVPRLRFGLRNEAGIEIYSWTAQPDQSILAPGATLPFRSRLASPPSEGHDVVVRFFNQRDATEGAR